MNILLENYGSAGGGRHNFGAKKMSSGIKSDYIKSCLIPGEYRIAMTGSLLERIFCDVISLKAERPTT